MKLARFRIQNFRSIDDSGEVTADPNITVFLGKNEAGKSTVLRAVTSLNNDYNYKPKDLPLGADITLKLHNGEISENQIPILTAYFDISEDDRPQLSAINSDLANISELKVIKYYDSHYEFFGTDEKPLNSVVDLDPLKQSVAASVTVFRAKLDAHRTRLPAFVVSKQMSDNALELLGTSEWLSRANIEEHFQSAFTMLQGLQGKDAGIQADINLFVAEITALKTAHLEALGQRIEERLLLLLPRAVYISSMVKLEDSISHQEFLSNLDAHPTFKNLALMVGLTRANFENIRLRDYPSRRGYIENRSKVISGPINEFWTQEQYVIELAIESDQVNVLVKDKSTSTGTAPSERSDGLQWLLSFYISFSAGMGAELKSAIILLDNPAAELHMDGQRDLLKIIENQFLKGNNHIFYATHSPALVDLSRLERARLVVKEKSGTKLSQYLYGATDTLEPIRSAIGCSLASSVFGGKKTVLVEGMIDYYVLSALNRWLEREGKEHLDSETVINGALGAPKLPGLASIYFSLELPAVVLVDDDDQGRQAAEKIQQIFAAHDSTKKRHCPLVKITCASTKKGADACIEDMLSKKNFHQLVNRTYHLKDPDETVRQQGDERNVTFWTARLKKEYDRVFSKEIIASSISQLLDSKKVLLDDETIKNFESLIKELKTKFSNVR